MIIFNKKYFKGVKSINVACSMGSDSVAISYFLANGHRPLTLHYVNHGTPYAPTAEKKFVEYSEFLNKNCKSPVDYVIHKDENLNSESFGEAEFRDFRYSKFDNYFIGKSSDKERLVVCHHLEDAIENFIMSTMTTGTVKRKLNESTERSGYLIVRPILTKKESIWRFIKKHNLKDWIVEDPSNSDVKFKRNWIRHELIPKIKEGYPGIETVVKKMYL